MTRRTPHDDEDEELAPLPPLDGEEDARDDAPVEDIDLDEGPESLDDAVADDAQIGLFDEVQESDDAGDDEPWSDAPIGDDDGIEESDERWSDAREEPVADDDSEVDIEESEAEGDRGEEGPEGEDDEAVDPLPPLDDDDDDGHGGDDEGHLADDHHDLLPATEVARVRRLRGCAVAMGLSLGLRRLLVVGDGVTGAAVESLDDPDADLKALDAPADQIFTSVAEAEGGVFLGSIEGTLLRKRPKERGFSTVFDGREGEARGPLEVLAHGRRVWCYARGQRLHVSPDGARFELSPMAEPVRAMAVDPSGAVLVATSRRARGALWKAQEGAPLVDVTPPEGESLAEVACAGETLVGVCAARLPGVLSVDGGARWTSWPCLVGASSVALVETDDGVVRVLFALFDEVNDRAVLAEAVVGPTGECVAPRRIAVIDHEALPSGDADGEPECKVERIVPLDRTARRVAVATARGVVLVERGE